jgi:hypothetical protein
MTEPRVRRAKDGKVLPESRCPNCGHLIDAASPTPGDEGRPQPGDIAVCIQCRHVALFDEAMRLRPPTPDELKEIAAENPEVEIAVVNDQGNLDPLESLPPEICQACGRKDELRPYGKRVDGVRQWICFDCARKNPEEMARAFAERMRGQNPVR